MSRKILVTGSNGFVGSNFMKYWTEKYNQDELIGLDALTYAARKPLVTDGSYHFIQADIRDRAAIHQIFKQVKPQHAIHFAAQSHVDRSIEAPDVFFETNAMGTLNLLQEFRALWGNRGHHRFHHVSTDEVFGQLGSAGTFNESSPIAPTSPYAASKAASDLMVQCFAHTYDLNTTITNCTNNYGPNQHPEKLIPKAIYSILAGKPMTLHGNGDHIRDWIHVVDHCRAIDQVFHFGKAGERYCIGGNYEQTNVKTIEEVYYAILEVTKKNYPLKWVRTDDRPTDDFRYAVDNTKINRLNWSPNRSFQHLLRETVEWYLENPEAENDLSR